MNDGMQTFVPMQNIGSTTKHNHHPHTPDADGVPLNKEDSPNPAQEGARSRNSIIIIITTCFICYATHNQRNLPIQLRLSGRTQVLYRETSTTKSIQFFLIWRRLTFFCFFVLQSFINFPDLRLEKSKRPSFFLLFKITRTNLQRRPKTPPCNEI